MNPSAHTPDEGEVLSDRPTDPDVLHEFLGCRAICIGESGILNSYDGTTFVEITRLDQGIPQHSRQQQREGHIARKYTEARVAALC